MRSSEHIEDVWQRIVEESKIFATQHNIDVNITERRHGKKKMDGEEGLNVAFVGEQRLRLSMFIPILDELCNQLDDRFSDVQVNLMKEMAFFSTGNFKDGCRKFQAKDIERLASIYNFDADQIVAEYDDFSKTLCSSGILDDVDEAASVQLDADQQLVAHSDDEYDENDPPEPPPGEQMIQQRVIPVRRKHSFLIPLKILHQLSGYPHLLLLYSTLVTLPVTSCSAERALSRLRIIKNRLRSSMCDDWLRALMVLASEYDVLSAIHNASIIDAFANTSNRLKQQLLSI